MFRQVLRGLDTHLHDLDYVTQANRDAINYIQDHVTCNNLVYTQQNLTANINKTILLYLIHHTLRFHGCPTTTHDCKHTLYRGWQSHGATLFYNKTDGGGSHWIPLLNHAGGIIRHQLRTV